MDSIWVNNMYISVKDGKVWDICSELRYKRTKDSLSDDAYLKIDDIERPYIDDTWDITNNISLKDSDKRNIERPMSLEERIKEIETILGI